MCTEKGTTQKQENLTVAEKLYMNMTAQQSTGFTGTCAAEGSCTCSTKDTKNISVITVVKSNSVRLLNDWDENQSTFYSNQCRNPISSKKTARRQIVWRVQLNTHQPLIKSVKSSTWNNTDFCNCVTQLYCICYSQNTPSVLSSKTLKC